MSGYRTLGHDTSASLHDLLHVALPETLYRFSQMEWQFFVGASCAIANRAAGISRTYDVD